VTQSNPCNPSLGETLSGDCIGHLKKDCTVSEWDEWKGCSATCGYGVRTRLRNILQPPENLGEPCPTNLEEAAPCQDSPCAEDCQPVDCEFGDWSKWGVCDKCAGQRKRYRELQQPPSCGGKYCELPWDLQETANCPRKCHDHAWCIWDDWESWGSCSAQCGSGSQERTRYLKVAGFSHEKYGHPSYDHTLGMIGENVVTDLSMATRLQELQRRTKSLEDSRLNEVVLAFGAGGMGVFALVAFGRLASRPTQAQYDRMGARSLMAGEATI